jgi:hypothetical protein
MAHNAGRAAFAFGTAGSASGRPDRPACPLDSPDTGVSEVSRLYRAAAAAVVTLGLAACSSSASKPVQHTPPPPTYPASAAPSAGGAAGGASGVTVCIKPYLKAQCGSNEQAEPTSITLSQDGTINLGSITWTGWGTATATGTGLVYSNDCKPSCTAGAQSKTQVTITLTTLQKWQAGQAYDDMSVTGIPEPYTAQYSAFSGLVP